MNVALLGADDESLTLLRHLLRNPTNRLIAAYDVDNVWRERLRDAAGEVSPSENWEALLHDPLADLVLVSQWPADPAARERRTDQWRKLANTSLQLVAVHPAAESILAFEIAMIRQEMGDSLRVFHGDVEQPIFERLRRMMVEGANEPDGTFEQLTLERWFDQRSPDRLRVDLARDMALIRWLLGDVRRVGGLGQAFAPGTFDLAVHLETQSRLTARWSIGVGPSDARVRITLVGTRETVTVRQDRERGEWAMYRGSDELAVQSSVAPAARFAARLMGDETSPFPISWMDGARAQEVAEAAERSVQRRRTIELFNEPHSEEDTFKGVMAVGSCLLLFIALAILVFGAIVEGIRYPAARARWKAQQEEWRREHPQSRDAPPAPVNRSLWLRLWPVYPLMAFLALQALRVIARGETKPSREAVSTPLRSNVTHSGEP